MSFILTLIKGVFSGGTSILSKIGVYALVLVIGLAIGGYAGYKVESAASAKAEVAAMAVAQKKYDTLAKQQNAAATTYEQQIAAIKAQDQARVVTIQKIVTRPIYKNVCLDADGLKAADEALTGKVQK